MKHFRCFSILSLFLIFTVTSCKKETCSDGIQNQSETGVDCGGECDDCPTCNDGIQNGDETGVDCGGSICPDCTNSGGNDSLDIGLLEEIRWNKEISSFKIGSFTFKNNGSMVDYSSTCTDEWGNVEKLSCKENSINVSWSVSDSTLEVIQSGTSYSFLITELNISTLKLQGLHSNSSPISLNNIDSVFPGKDEIYVYSVTYPSSDLSWYGINFTEEKTWIYDPSTSTSNLLGDNIVFCRLGFTSGSNGSYYDPNNGYKCVPNSDSYDAGQWGYNYYYELSKESDSRIKVKYRSYQYSPGVDETTVETSYYNSN